MEFDPGLDMRLSERELSFQYGPGVVGPNAEFRRLDAIRPSLRDPQCAGPDPVYGIAMDVGRQQDGQELRHRMLLFGAVLYAAGTLGEEPVRSQGHIHARAPHSGWSPPELFEIWEGSAIIYAQETAEDDPGRCFAVTAKPGDQVVVPPGWAHCVVNADPSRRMAFGACCDREYGFDYRGVRAHGGLAWFPLLNSQTNLPDALRWTANPAYLPSQLIVKSPNRYPQLGLDPAVSIYQQFLRDPESVQWVSEPESVLNLWENFVP